MTEDFSLPNYEPKLLVHPSRTNCLSRYSLVNPSLKTTYLLSIYLFAQQMCILLQFWARNHFIKEGAGNCFVNPSSDIWWETISRTTV